MKRVIMKGMNRYKRKWLVFSVVFALAGIIYYPHDAFGVSPYGRYQIGPYYAGELRFSFAIITDIHNNDYWLSEIVDWINENKDKDDWKIAFVMVLGDISNHADESLFQPMKDILDELEIPYAPLIGNHDVADPYYCGNPSPLNKVEKAFNDVFRDHIQHLLLPISEIGPSPVWNTEPDEDRYSYFQNYAFDIYSVTPVNILYHFVCLDFCARKEGGTGSDWWCGNADLHEFGGGTTPWLDEHLKRFLRKHRALADDHVFLFSHHPPSVSCFGGGILGMSDYNRLIGNYLGEKYQDDIGYWFAGHIHSFEEYEVRWPAEFGDYGRKLCDAVRTGAAKDGSFRVVSIYTRKIPNGDGGGDGCPIVYIWDGAQFVKENSILPGSQATSMFYTDCCNLTNSPKLKDGNYIFQIREFENAYTYLDRVKLIAVDHPNNISAELTIGGKLIVYDTPEEYTLLSCIDNYGVSQLPAVVSQDTLYCTLQKGDWLEFDFEAIPGDTIPEDKGMWVCVGPKPPEMNIPVWVVSYASPPETLGAVYPRGEVSTSIIEVPQHYEITPSLKFKIHATADTTAVNCIKLRRGIPLDSLIQDSSLEVKVCSLNQAIHYTIDSVGQFVTEHLLLVDDITTPNKPGEYWELRFNSVGTLKEGWARSFILASTGAYTGEILSSPPWRIRLAANADFSDDTLNYAGVEYVATDGVDEGYDIPEPDTLSSPYLQFYFPHPEWEDSLIDKLCQDIRYAADLSDSTIVFEFEVNTDQSDKNITLNTTPLDVPEEYGIYLLDLENNYSQDMKTNPEYTYNSGAGGVHRFQLSVGLGGINHAGGDWIWTVDSTREICGRHYNIDTLIINQNAIMNVNSYNGSDTITGTVRIEAKKMNILGTLSGDMAGYGSSEGPGAGADGGGTYNNGSGAGYGGKGGYAKGGESAYPGGPAYADSSQPIDMGSGGGNATATSSIKGGKGGGAIQLICAGTITLNGTLSSNGGDGHYDTFDAGGGGSGGSIWITTDSLSGSGTITTDGGAGGESATNLKGGAGAGGRVHIEYTNSSFNGKLSSSGGSGGRPAADGQIGSIWLEQADGLVDIVVSPVDTTIGSHFSREGLINSIEFTNTSVCLSQGDTILGNVNIKAKDSIMIASGAYIIADCKGYHSSKGTGEGTDGGAVYNNGSGAGFGNTGGCAKGGCGAYPGGVAYGDSIVPVDLGSGGGNATSTSTIKGGVGGGRIKLESSNLIRIDGILSANGADGNYDTFNAAGGGSGGSVYIIADTLLGTGTITANGGDGGTATTSPRGGGGAGGRVCFARNGDSFTGDIEVNGGVGPGDAQDGGEGTIYYTTPPGGDGGAQCSGELAAPKVFKLYQNYPNPFLRETTIKYAIPRKANVSLKIYDVAGRCVKTLVNEEKKVGYYKVKWDAEELSTGIYFAKFKAGDYKSTKKLILLK